MHRLYKQLAEIGISINDADETDYELLVEVLTSDNKKKRQKVMSLDGKEVIHG